MPLVCPLASWPKFSGGPAELERLGDNLLSLDFNALDYSSDDLTVIVGEIFIRVCCPNAKMMLRSHKGGPTCGALLHFTCLNFHSVTPIK